MRRILPERLAGESAERPGKRASVLICDDDPAVREILGRALKRDGLQVRGAATGDEAIALCEERLPDLLLLDVEMPGMDGFDTCERVRGMPGGGESLPIVMITGADDVHAIERAFAAGATDFIGKPINWLVLSHRVRSHLRAQTHLDALRRSESRLENAQRLARLGSWQLDFRTGEFFASEVLLDIVGGGRGLATLEDLAERTHPEDRATVAEAVQQARDSGEAVSFDHRIVRPGGAERMLQCEVHVVLDEEGDASILEGVLQDVTERRRSEERVRYLVYHDELTQLGNRRHLEQQLHHAIGRARKRGSYVGVMMLDLDHFKRINDTLSHRVGDALLQEVASRLLGCVRGNDVISRQGAQVSRLGGDEFTLFLPEIRDPQHLSPVARRILASLREPFDLDGHEVVIGASLGISVFPTDGSDVETLIRNADAALNFSKEHGRGEHHFYNASMNQASMHRLLLEARMRKALEEGDFELHYQPKVSLADDRIVGFEGLLRWRDPEIGLISPGDFIPVAETTGLILELGEWVVAEAARQAAAWQAAGRECLPIAVNLSPREFRSPGLADRITRAVVRSGASPDRLGFEVTESTVLDDTDAAIEELRELRRNGFQVALDDFGTGYSSLSYLRRLPVDVVKIDRSFIQDIEGKPDAAALTASIIQMAKALGLTTVAEGVEEREQRALLRDWKCDEFQGFLFSRPLCAADAEALLDRSAS